MSLTEPQAAFAPPVTEQSAPLLSVVGLTKRFRARRSLLDVVTRHGHSWMTAVDGLTLEVHRRETLGIVGESGCGKSTFARCLVRLATADAGTIRFEGQDVLAMTGVARRTFNQRVQMVFQDPYGSLNPRMKIGSALAEALVVHAIVPRVGVKARVNELLDLVHLPAAAAERYPHELSGGQRQRVGIARALAVAPAMLIADEPVSALDVSVQAQIINLFLELQARLDLSLVFITHDLRLVRHIAHRTAVMYLGRIVEIGPTEDLFSAPRHPYTQSLVSAAPKLSIRPRAERNRQAAVKGELPSPFAPPPGCAFHPRCPIAIERCKIETPSLLAGSSGGAAWQTACHLAHVTGLAPSALSSAGQ